MVVKSHILPKKQPCRPAFLPEMGFAFMGGYTLRKKREQAVI